MDQITAEQAVAQFFESADGKAWLERVRNAEAKGLAACIKDLQAALTDQWPGITENERKKRFGIAAGRLRQEANLPPVQQYRMPKAMEESVLRREVINGYPRPVACAYHRLMNDAKTPQEKLLGLLDCAEALAHSLSAIVLGLYLQQPKPDREAAWDREIHKTIFEKGKTESKLSFGDWVGLAIGTAKHIPKMMPQYGELLQFLQNSEVGQLLVQLVTLRNENSHSQVHSAQVAERHLAEHLPVLQRLLSAAVFFTDIELLVPLEYQQNQLMRADRYEGDQCFPNEPFTLPLPANSQIADMPCNRTVLAHFKKAGQLVSLYPFLMWHAWLELKQDGAYCISKIESQIKLPQREITSVTYCTYESGLAGAGTKNMESPKDAPEESRAIERLLRLLEIPCGVCVRSFVPLIPSPAWDKNMTMCDVSDLFAGRFLKDPTAWPIVTDRITAFFQQDKIKQLPQPIQILFDTHLSVAFFIGQLLNPKWGALFVPWQKSRTDEYEAWSLPQNQDYPSNLWAGEIPPELSREVVVGVSITNPIDKQVDHFLHKTKPRAKWSRLFLQPKNGVTRINGEQGWQLAHDLNQLLRKQLPANCQKLHLFCSVPAAFAYALGQELRHIAPVIQLYEYDFEGKTLPEHYAPSITIQ